MVGDFFGGIEVLLDERRRHALSTAGIRKAFTRGTVDRGEAPYFVDALQPEQVWLMERNEEGHTAIRQTSTMPVISDLRDEGIPLGSLWYSNHFEESFDG